MIQKIGILGGTFDPIHLGHFVLAQKAYEELNLDKVVLVPANYPWLKKPLRLTDSFHRINMINLLIKNYSWLELSNIDILRGGNTYTKDTLEELKNIFPLPTKMYLILGSDNFHDFHKWKNYERILELANIVIAKRPNFEINSNDFQNIKVLNSSMLDISSTIVREKIKKGFSMNKLIPLEVINYINNNKLYT
ncbi:MAG: nicotinate (nicotinamide) nucleotide adenylyltransferase [Chloroflexi bacterium]|nr:nicotinate (nicotinamide) nucleotide adenylyltransferase [Chloroflexota bacterium]